VFIGMNIGMGKIDLSLPMFIECQVFCQKMRASRVPCQSRRQQLRPRRPMLQLSAPARL
jgi:hypothetical protein